MKEIGSFLLNDEKFCIIRTEKGNVCVMSEKEYKWMDVRSHPERWKEKNKEKAA